MPFTCWHARAAFTRAAMPVRRCMCSAVHRNTWCKAKCRCGVSRRALDGAPSLLIWRTRADNILHITALGDGPDVDARRVLRAHCVGPVS
jgi:hypothetical protein